MYIKTMTYTDFDGNKRTEDLHFNFTKAEILRLDREFPGGLSEKLIAVVKKLDPHEIVETFEWLIQKAFGVREDNGRRFVKRPEDLEAFMETQAYSDLLMEIVTNPSYAAEFVNQIVPPSASKDKVE